MEHASAGIGFGIGRLFAKTDESTHKNTYNASPDQAENCFIHMLNLITSDSRAEEDGDGDDGDRPTDERHMDPGAHRAGLVPHIFHISILWHGGLGEGAGVGAGDN